MRTRTNRPYRVRSGSRKEGGPFPSEGIELEFRDGGRLSQSERLASIGLGLIGLFALSRRLLLYVGIALTSSYLLYRGLVGRCPILATWRQSAPEEARRMTRGPVEPEHGPDAVLQASRTSSAKGGGTKKDDPERETATSNGSDGAQKAREAADEVEEASRESFPASDPPANW